METDNSSSPARRLRAPTARETCMKRPLRTSRKLFSSIWNTAWPLAKKRLARRSTLRSGA